MEIGALEMGKSIDDIKYEEIDDELSGLSGGANNPSNILDKKLHFSNSCMKTSERN
jgi:hypothetical protein